MAGKRTTASKPTMADNDGQIDGAGNGQPKSDSENQENNEDEQEPIDKTDGNNGSDKRDTINPADLAGENIGGDRYERDADGNIVTKKDGSPRKKRGRRAGNPVTESKAGNVSSVKRHSRNDSVNNLADTLQVIHSGIAMLIKFDDFALDSQEATQLAKATANFMQEFDVEVSPKVTAATGLVTTAAMIYAPRIYLYKEMQKEKRLKKVAERGEENPARNDPTQADYYNLGG